MMPRTDTFMLPFLLIQPPLSGWLQYTADGKDLQVFAPSRRHHFLPSPSVGKSAKRRLWRMKRADFEEVSRFSAETAAGNRLTRRWARGGRGRKAEVG